MDHSDYESLNIAYELGVEAKKFINSPIGQSVATRAANEIDKLVEKLIDVDSTDAKAIAKLQLDIKARSLTLNWISQAIDIGDGAGQQLDQMDADSELED